MKKNFCSPQCFSIYLAKGYQRYISPLLPPVCRFTPSCSEYFVEAVEKYGLIRGGGMAFLRILRCNPLCRGGYDPVK
ncbi:MAG: membrane protein insertion efficiency factor YidD [Deltaproteobacteria bacterium]|nr:MAG: membrane protein insertion efficiency factor YidD [Deltaproteobacteria bacterium]